MVVSKDQVLEMLRSPAWRVFQQVLEARVARCHYELECIRPGETVDLVHAHGLAAGKLSAHRSVMDVASLKADMFSVLESEERKRQ